ncbi:MAG: O-antigen ligase family protein [Acidobacteriota bacterium]|nr:O-antigen ligase family protein [Acidobacteriota bacterium]
MSRFKPSPVQPLARPVATLPANPLKLETPLPVLPSAGPAPGAVRTEHKNFLQSIGYFALVLYVFSWASYINEICIAYFGMKPYISMIAGPVAVLALVAGGSIMRGFRTRVGVYWTALLVWMVIGAPFSVWRSDTLKNLLDYGPKVHVIFFLMCAALFTVKDCRVMIYANLAGGFILVALCFMVGKIDASRFVIPSGSFLNPNALALQLLVAACLFIMLVMHRNMLVRIIGLVGIGTSLPFILKTASRGSFVAILAVIVALFFTVQRTARFKMVIAVMVLAVPALMVVPPTALNRIVNIAVMSEQQTEDETYALSSQLSRQELLKESLKYTLTHPIFGVGTGEFGAAVWGDGEKAGIRTAWAGTHNSFTQISAECGIPALIFYTAVVFLCTRMNRRLYKATRGDPAMEDISSIALTLYLTMVAFAVNTFFFHTAYGYYLSTLAGLSVALQFASAARVNAAAPVRNATQVVSAAPSFRFPALKA